MEWMRRGLKHYTWKRSELRNMMPQYKKIRTLSRKFPDKYSWVKTRKRYRGGVASLAAEIDTHEKTPEGMPLNWQFDYEWIYFWTSQYVRATALSIETHAWEPPKKWKTFKPFLMHVAPNRGEHTAGLAVFNVSLYLHRVLVMTFRALGQPFPDSIFKPLRKLLTSMIDDVAKNR